MNRFRMMLSIMMTFWVLTSCFIVIADDRHGVAEVKDGPYVVVEGYVKQVSARILILNDQQYPISIFARVFDANGTELSVQMLANIGKIDRAKIYLLGGKIEKIIVLKNI